MEIVFESQKILYVKLNEELVDDYLLMVNDREIQININREGKINTFTKEQELGWIKSKLEDNALVFSMIEKGSNKFIGNIEIIQIVNNIGELGICITRDMQDKHYGSEAIKEMIKYTSDELKLSGLELNVHSTNKRAIHCYEKIGFVRDGSNGNEIHMRFDY